MDRILVGTDGSARAGVAVGWAAELAKESGALLVVASATRPEIGGTEHDDQWDAADHRRFLLEQVWCQPAGDVGVSFEAVAVEGDPRAVLLELADKEQVDLVVVGSHGSGGFLGLGLGSTAAYLAHHAQRPLAVVPGPGGPLAGGRVTVGVDGHRENARALGWAVEAARDVGAAVAPVFVYNPIEDTYPHSKEPWVHAGEERARHMVQQVAGVDTAVGLTVVGGDTTTEINSAAERDDAAFIVVGTQSHAGFDGLFIGRVPMQMLHVATRPVVIVPHSSSTLAY